MVRDALDRRVRPVRCAERVVDIEIGERGQRGRESGIVLLLLAVKAEVLEKHQAATALRLRRSPA